MNLAIRFILELAALAALGTWGYNLHDSWLRFLLAILIPLFAALAWGIFNVPDDPSRSGKAPVIVPGVIRLLLELSVFFFAVWALIDLGYRILPLILGITVILHYIASHERIAWLIRQSGRK
jgi:hypothetical protein